jgi:hypothetical protein
LCKKSSVRGVWTLEGRRGVRGKRGVNRSETIKDGERRDARLWWNSSLQLWSARRIQRYRRLPGRPMFLMSP